LPPELVAPELVAPELVAPELVAPELVAPELVRLWKRIDGEIRWKWYREDMV
jgi:hypothetical protein